MTDEPHQVERRGVWGRLRRRKVVQWGIAYGAASWGFLQGLEYVSDAFGWPSQIRQVAILALLIGLPVVLIIAWYHGDRGEQRVGGTELVLIALLFLLGGGIFWLYGQRSEPPPAAGRAPKSASTPVAAEERPSIAVLPFENRSTQEDDAFFVDGIHDDILTQLSRIGALKVIARTSVEQFRDTRLTTREIGERLGVTKVLEGGVQRAGDRVRITVQLIDAATDGHLWAESYDRELTAANVFAIQSEVAAAIADALQATLTPAQKKTVDAVPTQSLEAWESYQLGRQRMAQRTVEGLGDAERFFRRAVRLDPKFAQAYAGLADAIWLKADFASEPWLPAVGRAQEVVETALSLDPDLVEAVTTAAKLADSRGNLEVAEAGYRRAIALNPNYVPAYHWYGGLLAKLGRDEEALAMARTTVALDPLWPLMRVSLGALLGGLGRFDEALAEFRRANEIDPRLPAPYSQIGMILASVHGRVAEAIPWFERAAALDPGSQGRAAQVAALLLDLEDDASAERWLDRARSSGSPGSPGDEVAAMGQLYRGRHGQALELARRAFKRDPSRPWSLWPLRLLRDADLQAGQHENARNRYASAFPELVSGDPRQLVYANYQAAIDLALVLQLEGDHPLAGQLLDRCEALIRKSPRMGQFGYRIEDVRIDALRGKQRLALRALRDATQSGWRGPYWRYYRDFDPALASIRDEPEFKAVFADIERDMARQRAELAARPVDAPLDLDPSR